MNPSQGGFSLGSGLNAGDYSWSYKPGGADYFLNGNPITNSQYDVAATQASSPLSTVIERGAPALPSTPDASSSTSSAASGGTGSTATANPAAGAMYDQQAQSYEAQLANLDPALAQTLSDISSGYNKAVTGQNQAFSDATQNYNTTKANDQSNEQTLLDNISTQTRNAGNSIQRLLGMAGSGNSSAAQVAAPYYVNREGANANKQAETTFGQNQQALDTSFNRATRDNQTALDNLAQQQFASQQQARQSNANDRASLLQNIIGALGNKGNALAETGAQVSGELAPWVGQLNNAVQSAAGFTGKYQAPVFQTNPQVYQAPSLASYWSGVNTPQTQAALPNPNAGQNVQSAQAGVVQAPKQPLLAQLA
jgi:hypothetical protein